MSASEMVISALIGAHSEDDSSSETATDSFDKLVLVCITVLEQAINLVEKTLTKDDQLIFQSSLIPGSTIGKHLRHAHDHFTLLLNPLLDDALSPDQTPTLSYDTRIRNTPMETSRGDAGAAMKHSIKRLEQLCELNRVGTIQVNTEVSLEAVTPFPQTLKTTVGRELWFASLHAIHHWSMARVVAGEQDIELDPTFGVAPSTLLYRGQLEESATARAKI